MVCNITLDRLIRRGRSNKKGDRAEVCDWGGGDYRVKLRTLAPSCTITMSHCHWKAFLKCWMFTFAELSLVIKSGIFLSAKSVIAFWAQDRHQAEVREVAKLFQSVMYFIR